MVTDVMAISRNSEKHPRNLWLGLMVLLTFLSLEACNTKTESEDVRPVRNMVIETHMTGDLITLTGQLNARHETKLAFRLSGKLVERLVATGDIVKADQIVAKLDAETERNTRDAAKADYTAAVAFLDQSEAAERRYGNLINEKAVSQAEYEEALKQLKTARSQVKAARAKLDSAEDQLGYTVLKADADGVITAKGAEPGEVVQVGQMIVALAHEKGRDAVFDMPAQIIRDGISVNQEVEVWLVDNPDIKTTGKVREISPQADPSTRTYQVKVGLDALPSGMFLGSTVVGRLKLRTGTLIEIPSSALAMAETKPAVWIIDPKTNTVHKREIEITRYTQDAAIVASGLQSGERIVTAGVQSLFEGQKVKLLEGENGRP